MIDSRTHPVYSRYSIFFHRHSVTFSPPLVSVHLVTADPICFHVDILAACLLLGCAGWQALPLDFLFPHTKKRHTSVLSSVWLLHSP